MEIQDDFSPEELAFHEVISREEYLTPGQLRAIREALDSGTPVLFLNHPALGDMGFLIFRPVSEFLEGLLTGLVKAAEGDPKTGGDFGNTVYVVGDPNYPQPYWRME